MKYSKSDILDLFSGENNGELAYKEIIHRLGINVQDRKEFRQQLVELVRADVLRLRKGRWYRKGAAELKAVQKKESRSALSVRQKAYQALYDEVDLPVEFPDKVANAALDLPQSVEEIPDGVVDLQHIPLVTIDPKDARDFDDAVAVLQRPDAPGYRLYVAIADVSYYVKQRSVIDREAFNRSTSVYVTGTVIPMLPFELSAGICSLKAEVKRMAMVAILDYSLKGEVEKIDFCEAVIMSRASLSYEMAQEILLGKSKAEPELAESFSRMKALFYTLARKRKQRGSLDLSISEPKVDVDDNGVISGVRKAVRFEAHRLVEEFMLAANAAVAEFLSDNNFPCVYRVHEKPDADKVNEFADVTNALGYHFNTKGKLDGKSISKYLDSIAGVEEENYLNTLLLRSLKQAVYTNVNIGHFGLALKKYCHFTSPIRRYPDLETHRQLKRCIASNRLGKQRKTQLEKRLASLGEHCSLLERRAVKLERKSLAICKAEYMEQFIGEKYSGIISGAMEFGFFVQVDSPFIEGMVHVSQLGKDFYNYDEDQHALIGERSKNRFRLGDKVEVQLTKVDVPLGRIDFSLVDDEEDRRPSKYKKRNAGKKYGKNNSSSNGRSGDKKKRAFKGRRRRKRY